MPVSQTYIGDLKTGYSDNFHLVVSFWLVHFTPAATAGEGEDSIGNGLSLEENSGDSRDDDSPFPAQRMRVKFAFPTRYVSSPSKISLALYCFLNLFL